MSVSVDRLFQIRLEENPFFNTLSQEIHLPFSFAEYAQSAQHQASVLHEYVHLIQANTTVFGIYNFIGTSERLAHFLNAVKGRSELKFPILEWARASPNDEHLREYLGYEEYYQKQRRSGDGAWLLERNSTAGSYSMEKCDVQIAEHSLSRWHVHRDFQGSRVLVPILGNAICEAQAECVATYFQGIDSTILQMADRESTKELLVYTSLPALVQRRLPQFPLHETVFLLSDYALMTFSPDVAFIEALEFLRTEEVPKRLSEWDDLRDKIEAKFGFESRSLESLLPEIEKKLRFFGRYSKNEIMSMFLQKLERAKKALEMRKDRPFQFFPWERTIESLQQDLMSIVPIAHAKFTDGVHALGAPSAEEIRTQSVLGAASFLFEVMRGEKSPQCPLFSDLVACGADRTIDCKQFPWSRGDIGRGQMCIHGFLGKSLGIESAVLSRIESC